MAGSISPEASFYLCPDFSISPPPDRHLQLGSVLRGLKADGVLNPLDAGATISIPELRLLPVAGPQTKEGFTRSLKELRSIQSSIWAKIFGWDGLGAAFSALRKRENDETLTVPKLFVRYFIPTLEDMKNTLEIDGVAFYVRNTKYKKPVYLVTGLMWTEGARLSKIQSKNNKVNGQAAGTDPHSGTTVGASGAFKGEDCISSSFDGSTPFILGIRVRKIWWDKEGTRQDELDVVGATLGDGTGKKAHVLDGLKFAEADDGSGQILMDETQLGEPNPVKWILP